MRESKHFRSTFVTAIPCKDPPGSSETNPFVLEGVTSEAFADLLWVFYNPYAIIVFDLFPNSFVLKRILCIPGHLGEVEENYDARPTVARGLHTSPEALREGAGKNNHAAG